MQRSGYITYIGQGSPGQDLVRHPDDSYTIRQAHGYSGSHVYHFKGDPCATLDSVSYTGNVPIKIIKLSGEFRELEYTADTISGCYMEDWVDITYNQPLGDDFYFRLSVTFSFYIYRGGSTPYSGIRESDSHLEIGGQLLTVSYIRDVYDVVPLVTIRSDVMSIKFQFFGHLQHFNELPFKGKVLHMKMRLVLENKQSYIGVGGFYFFSYDLTLHHQSCARYDTSVGEEWDLISNDELV